MPVVPNFVERLAILRLNRGPGPMLDVVSAGGFHGVAAAIDLGVFEALRDGPRSVSDLADSLAASEDGLMPLLSFLDTLGYVERTGGTYANTPMTTRWLTDAEGTDLGPWLVWWDRAVFPFWAEHLTTAVREGEPSVGIYEWAAEDPERERLAQAGFEAVARLVVDDAVDEVPVSADATRLLDVGGGHGLAAAAFCRAHAGLDATVFDLPAAETYMQETMEREGMADRVGFVGGDYTTDDLGAGYDVALVFNVVHAHDAAENRALLARVADALAPGGTVAVLDQFEGSAYTPAWKAALQFVGLTYLVTLGARIHDADEVAAWLADAGFEGVRRERVGPGVGLLVAEKAVA